MVVVKLEAIVDWSWVTAYNCYQRGLGYNDPEGFEFELPSAFLHLLDQNMILIIVLD
jgi:hypothetical protein